MAAVIGEAVRTEGFALAGAMVLTAESSEQAHAAWRSLPTDVTVVVLTASVAAWLADILPSGPEPSGPRMLLVVMPA
jgi:vacuolar-type H+-ATPase subunit F/Vma7